MVRADDWDNDEDPPRRRRNRDRYEDEDDDDYDYDRVRRGRSRGRSGAVTAVGIISMVIGSLVILLGLCLMIGVVFVGEAGRMGGGLDMQGIRVAMVIGVIVVLLVLLWGTLAIIAGIGILNRRQWGRILVLVASGIGAAVGLLFLVGAIGALGGNAPDARGGAVLLFLMALVLLGYCVWSYVVLLNSRNAFEFR